MYFKVCAAFNTTKNYENLIKYIKHNHKSPFNSAR